MIMMASLCSPFRRANDWPIVGTTRNLGFCGVITHSVISFAAPAPWGYNLLNGKDVEGIEYTLSQQIKIKTRVGRPVRFPAVCVHCGKPAPERMRVHKRIGRTTRLVDVPLCAECAHETHRLSGEEERWHRLSWLFSAIAWLLAFLLLLLLMPVVLSPLLRLILAALAATAVAFACFRVCRRIALRHARPEKKAILGAARIRDFSWRATTFEFSNEHFAEHFAAENANHLFDAQ
jgi:hypothetical protein